MTATSLPAATPPRAVALPAPAGLPGLVDLTLTPCRDGGLSTPGRAGDGMSAQQIAGLIDGAALGVRMLVADGARYRTLFAGVARILDRDVFIAPGGADIRILPAAAGAEPVPVDRATGRRTDWLALGPGTGAALPTWFTLTGGTVRQRHGTVSIPLPDGLCLATRANFAAWRGSAARLAAGHPGLVTIGVGTVAGDLLTGHYDGRVRRRDGRQLAADLATLPLYGADVRVWLAWPDEPGQRRRLRSNLERLAHSIGAVVWVPGPDGRIDVADDCADLTVTGATWEALRPDRVGRLRFEGDRDGRLVPTGGFVVQRFRGVAAVSVPERRLRRMSEVYPRIRPRRGLTFADLTVLDDGRLAGRCADGSLLALGGARLRRILKDPADVALLAPVTAGQLDGLRQYLRHALPGCTVHLPASGCEVIVADDLPRVMDGGRPGAWVRLDAGDAPRWESSDGWLVPVHAAGPDPTDAAEDWPEGPFLGPQLESAARGDRTHGLTWLPDRPQVNAVPFTLYVPAGDSAEVPSPRLFLLGRLDPGSLAGEVRDGWLLQIDVGRHGAVDVPASDVAAPGDAAVAAARLGVYVLPAGWLPRSRAVSALRVAGGELIAAEPVGEGTMRIRCRAADHGVRGLPEEASVWPTPLLRRYRTCYALLPRTGDRPAWLALHQRPPAPDARHRLATLKVRAGAALDIAATAAHLAPLSAVHTEIDALLGTGTTLVLPRRAYDSTPVTRLAAAGDGRWHRLPHAAGDTVATVLRASPDDARTGPRQ